ncbi:hypothetical protein AA106555_0908 [Neokomagataea thailandica NBRC 106555]|uniref:Uncharacterized protein n=2 Tax=Neokomagataea TaxID=1223423 RepID=A0A4Y6V7B2_9PROT|nr:MULTISPECIES: hypothetical protein [Neokomagataea]QDH24570.1 hypothetical protein D5366_04185 [Neokomagataea tanensis]GBR52410.1 hypothetical protein AA106555_0908 [Neokomagataea thailandica NBRC 106555]
MSSARSFESLSVSRHRKTARRALTPLELATISRIADTLIPASGTIPSGSSVANYEGLLSQALGITDKNFDSIMQTLELFAHVNEPDLWERLKAFSLKEPSKFYWLSTVIVSAYLYAPENKARIGYPTPHPNPAGMFEIADELDSGVLDAVMERGPIYVSAD